MPSAQGSQKIFATNKLTAHSHTGSTSATVVEWQDMRDFGRFGVVATLAATGTGGAITQVEIVAADDDSGTNLTVIKDSETVAADAVDDQVALECQQEEIKEELSTGRYVAARVTISATDAVAGVACLRTLPRFAHDGLTATAIA